MANLVKQGTETAVVNFSSRVDQACYYYSRHEVNIRYYISIHMKNETTHLAERADLRSVALAFGWGICVSRRSQYGSRVLRGVPEDVFERG